MIKIGDIVVPRKTHHLDLLEDRKAMVMDAKLFPDPDDFKPVRHIDLVFLKKSIIYKDGFYPDDLFVTIDAYQYNLKLETKDGKEV